MKYIFCFVLCCLFFTSLFAQQYSLGAYQCEDTSWFPGAGKDSLGLNTIQYTHWPLYKDVERQRPLEKSRGNISRDFRGCAPAKNGV